VRKAERTTVVLGVPSTELGEARNAILRRAAVLFRRQGVANTTMKDVADAVGLSKAGLYHHYPSKDQLLADIVSRAVEVLLEQLERVRAADVSPADRLELFVVTRMEVIAAEQDVLTVFWQERPSVPEPVFREMARRLEAYRHGLVEIVQEAQKAGALRTDLDSELLMAAIDGMTGWAYLWYRKNGRYAPNEIGVAFWSFIASGVAASQHSSERGRSAQTGTRPML